MNCLIVDDNPEFREILRNQVNETTELVLIGECEDAFKAYEMLQKESIDILFLDQEMPGLKGTQLVERLENRPQIILISGKKDIGAKAFELGLTDYFLKEDLTSKRFQEAIEKAKKNLDAAILDIKGNQDHIYVKSDGKIVRIKLDDIFFVEALSDYVKINLEDKFLVVHSTMKAIANRLGSSFLRVHRSFIVKLSKVETIEDTAIKMPQKDIPIGASYKKVFLKKLDIF